MIAPKSVNQINSKVPKFKLPFVNDKVEKKEGIIEMQPNINQSPMILIMIFQKVFISIFSSLKNWWIQDLNATVGLFWLCSKLLI